MLSRSRNQQSNIARFVVMLLVALFTVSVTSCTQEKKEAPKPRVRLTRTKQIQKTAQQIDAQNAIAVIETAKGTIEMEFYASEAPETAKNFIKNIRLKYYNNERFHRVEPTQLIQAGSRMVMNETIPLEDNNLKLVRGSVVMAGDGTESHVAEFYICLDTLETAEQHTVFAKVTSGLDVIDKIEKDDKILKVTIREKD